MVRYMLSYLGNVVLDKCFYLGSIGAFVYQSCKVFLSTRLKIKQTLFQIHYIGIGSLGIVFLVGLAIGTVLAIQSYIGLERFGSTHMIGPIVFLSMVREFGPVFTALMVIGRSGSAMTAELGSMRISEQIDALETLRIDPLQYLVVPRIIACTFILPFLSMFCSFFGIMSGYLTSVYILTINSETYMEAIRNEVEMSDITNGLLKAFVFGILLSIIATYKGYSTRGGAKGLGISTTQSVVFANVTIIITDYIMTSLMVLK